MMNEIRRLSLRLEAVQYDHVERAARSKGLSVAEYIRSLIDVDINSDLDPVRRSLARHVIFTAYAVQQLLKLAGDGKDFEAVKEGGEHTIERLDLAGPKGRI